MTSAALRGVTTRLIVSRRSNGRLVELAQRSYYAELMRAGVEVHLSDVGFVHAKHMRIDRAIAIIGSCNMDVRSFRLNAEATLFCYDEPTADALAAVEERYYAEGEQLEPESWGERPLYRKTLENSARMLSDLL